MLRRNLEFICAVVIIGLLAGCAGLATTMLLRLVQHLTYHDSFGTLLAGVAGSSPVRRALGPLVGGALAGFGWWLLRSRTEVPPLAATIASRKRIPLLAWSIDAPLQVLLVGSGASLGREGAPRQLAAVFGEVGIGWLKRLPPKDREILLACAAGAGLGAVYAVPLAGALFAAQIILKSWHPRALGAALITSSLAVAVGSVVTHDHPILQWPSADRAAPLTVHALALTPLALVVGLGFNRLMTYASRGKLIRSPVLIPALAAAGLLTGVCSHWWPELPGNGRSILAVGLTSGLNLGAAAAILILKPALTAMFLRAGAAGGLLTPALATGAAAGSLFVLVVNAAFGGHMHMPAVSLAGAVGVLTITQRSPVWAAIFVWEISRPPTWLFLVFLVTAVGAHGLRLLTERVRGNRLG